MAATQLQDLLASQLEAESEVDESFATGKVYNIAKSNWHGLTRLPAAVVRDLCQTCIPYTRKSSGRGRAPSLSWMDHLCVMLMLYTLGAKKSILAAQLKIKPTCMEDAINRMRPILYQALRHRWNRKKFRPRLVYVRAEGAGEEEERLHSLAQIGLLLDSTSIEVYRKGRFEEAKHYWDGKNHIYALKKEVAVLAQPPYFALFMMKGRPGSIHDMEILKSTQKRYTAFLQKTAEEKAALTPLDGDNPEWAVLCDKGYQGARNLTPDIRRFTPKKKATSETDRRMNTRLARKRVPVEAFFGRMYKLFAFLSRPYPFEHAHFDEDIDIIIMLTNENIRATHPLGQADRNFYIARMAERRDASREREKKRQESKKRYVERVRSRFAVFDALDTVEEIEEEEEEEEIPPMEVEDEEEIRPMEVEEEQNSEDY